GHALTDSKRRHEEGVEHGDRAVSSRLWAGASAPGCPATRYQELHDARALHAGWLCDHAHRTPGLALCGDGPRAALYQCSPDGGDGLVVHGPLDGPGRGGGDHCPRHDHDARGLSPLVCPPRGLLPRRLTEDVLRLRRALTAYHMRIAWRRARP